MGGKIRGEMTGRELEFECLDVAMAPHCCSSFLSLFYYFLLKPVWVMLLTP